MPRFHSSVPLAAGTRLALPAGAARHVQVLRFQPGDALTLFDGSGGEYACTVQAMGRSEVVVDIGAHDPVEREAPRSVHLAVGMPANERMDWLLEKATELGAAGFRPLAAARGVLRLSGERAEKKRAHWQAVAVAACEQCGRNRVPAVQPVQDLAAWLRTLAADAGAGAAEGLRLTPSLAGTPLALPEALAASPAGSAVTLLSGPEGGFTAEEHALALAAGFVPVTLGNRVLRAETAPLAALAVLALGTGPPLQ